jgi:putative copper export protein
LAAVFRLTSLAAGWALIAGAAGSAILLAIALATVVGSAGPSGIVAFVTGTRSGALLLERILLGVVGGAAVLVLRRTWGTRGPMRALGLAGLVGLGGLVLTAFGSHAAAFASPVPLGVDIVHLAAASVWLSGLGLLATVTDFGRASRLAPGALRLIIPRFSALALVSVATIAFTGAYADWTLTRDPFSAASPYQLSLVVKIAVFAAALGLGAVNFVDGGEDRRWLGGLSRRLTAELLAGVAVLAIAANLTSGSPTAQDRPVGIEPAASTAASGAALSLDLLPGRAGPNRFSVDVADATPGMTVELVLQRLDADQGISRIAMRQDPATTAPRYVADANLAEVSQWDATVVETGAAGTETGRQRFVFALDADGVSDGRSVPPIDPALLLAVLLLGLGVVGLAFGLAGGVLPRTLPDASRPALLGASTVGALLGIAMIVVAGPR